MGKYANNFTTFAVQMKIQQITIRFVLLTLVTSIIFFAPSCKKEEVETIRLNARTINYLDFKNESTWQYSDNLDSSMLFTLKNWVKGKNGEHGGEFIFYDLEVNPDLTYKIRLEVGPTDMANRVSIIQKSTDDPISLSAIFLSIPDKFFIQVLDSDSMVFIGDFNLQNTDYTNVWKYSSVKNKYFSSLYFAENFGIIGFAYKGGKQFNLVSADLK